MAMDSDNWDRKQQGRGASFLQSAQWAKFQESMGLKYRLLEDKGWSCLLLEKTGRFGKYLFAPYGPTLDTSADLSDCIEALVAQARQAGADWLKLEPLAASGAEPLDDILAARGALRSVHNVEPALTRILDLSPAPDELLAGISQSTRSLIRKNQREGTLTFQTSVKPADMAAFASMLDTVAERKGVSFFSEDYFIAQAQQLMPAGMMFLEQAYAGKTLVGAAVMHDYGEFGSYTYAASLPEARHLSVSALLLWQAILNARSRGIKKMDLYGTAPDDAPPSHPWYGFSTYKKKFGGEVLALAGTWDIPLSRKYRLYRAAQTAHRILKRR
jgi:lipid II:glycine glycyltransferase (peptidoglycan interpeptide bridge formation enzyme)